MDDPRLAIEVMRRTEVLDPVKASAWQLDMAEIMIESGEADEGLRQRCEELPLDEQLRVQWLEMFTESAKPDTIS